ncbi:MAG: NUDIX domain-containing protein [Balneolaceae bacterium]
MAAGNLFAEIVRVRVSALIISNDHIVLVKQKVPTRPDPVWLPPGGGVETGEYSEQALVREVEEETNLTLQKTELKYVHEFVEPPYHAVELYFIAGEFSGTLKTGSDPEFEKHEQQILQSLWVPLEEVNHIELYPEFLRDSLLSGGYKNSGIYHYKS